MKIMTQQQQYSGIKVYNYPYSKEGLEKNSGYPVFDNNNNKRLLDYQNNSKKIHNINQFDPETPYEFPESCSQMDKFSLPSSSNKKKKKKIGSINLMDDSDSNNDFDSDERPEYEKINNEEEKSDNDEVIYDSDIDEEKTELELLKKPMNHEKSIPKIRLKAPINFIDNDTDSSTGSEYKNKTSPDAQRIDDDDDEEDDLEQLFLNDDKKTIKSEFDILVKEFLNIIDIDNHYLPSIEKFVGKGIFSEHTKSIFRNQANLISQLYALEVKSKGKNEWSKILNNYNLIIHTLPEIE